MKLSDYKGFEIGKGYFDCTEEVTFLNGKPVIKYRGRVYSDYIKAMISLKGDRALKDNAMTAINYARWWSVN